MKAIVAGTADATLLHNNANKASERIPVMRDFVAGEVAKHIALTEILPKDVAQAHIDGDIHYHDLDYAPFFPSFNCMLIDIKNMFDNGFKMGNADITTPKSIETACAIVAQVIAQVASHIYGGCTVNRIDEVLAPYVKSSYKQHYADGLFEHVGNEVKATLYAKRMIDREVYKAFKSLEYEINTLHTANGQAPFVTLGFGLGTNWESKLIQKAILDVRIKGLGKHHLTAVFPKLVFAIKEGVNRSKGDVNYDIKQLALECSSKRMYPDILNVEMLEKVTGGFKTPMGCRSFLHEHESGVSDGRNNMGVVSINLPRLAILAKGDFAVFWSKLEDTLRLSRDALQTRIDRLIGVTADVAPILYMEGACGIRLKAKDEVMQLFNNHRASVSLGYIGLHEVAAAMYGTEVHPVDSTEQRAFLLSVVARLHKATVQWSEESDFAFSVYSTPSESLCDRFCRLDKETFGEVAGVTTKGYYTNSFHLDVRKKVNVYDKLDFEEQYPQFATGGFICTGEYPNMKHNLSALEQAWDYSYTRVPYYATNTPIDSCYKCGFTGEFKCKSKGFVCPNCGNHESDTISVIRRVCGYLGAPDARPFIEGKQKEVMQRVKHVSNYD